jgi:glycosyltransferase involved in cell wall biosynthesis
MRLTRAAAALELKNTLFKDEIDPDEIPALYAQCHIGLVALDPRHRSHNIPGKFLTYMQSGLPVLATINPGNDLCDLIRNEKVGFVCEGDSLESLHVLAEKLLNSIEADEHFSERCTELFKRMFSAETAVRQIAAQLSRRA